MFPLVPAYPGCPGSKAVKRSLLLLLLMQPVEDTLSTAMTNVLGATHTLSYLHVLL